MLTQAIVPKQFSVPNTVRGTDTLIANLSLELSLIKLRGGGRSFEILIRETLYREAKMEVPNKGHRQPLHRNSWLHVCHCKTQPVFQRIHKSVKSFLCEYLD